jgi:hypothetical protein
MYLCNSFVFTSQMDKKSVSKLLTNKKQDNPEAEFVDSASVCRPVVACGLVAAVAGVAELDLFGVVTLGVLFTGVLCWVGSTTWPPVTGMNFVSSRAVSSGVSEEGRGVIGTSQPPSFR